MATIRDVRVDYGATGNGSTDDTTAIQNAFNDCFGSSGSPNGDAGKYSNKPLFFPAGQYKVTAELTLTHIVGGWIFGPGANHCKIFRTSATDGHSLISINGAIGLKWRGISTYIEGSGTNRAIKLDWDGTGTNLGLTRNLFSNMLVGGSGTGSNSTDYGIIVGEANNEGDANTFEHVIFNFCTVAGLDLPGTEATENLCIGCGGTNNGRVFRSVGGHFSIIQNISTANNTFDIDLQSDFSTAILGGRTENDFLTIQGSARAAIYGVTQSGASSLVLADLEDTSKVIIDDTTSPGVITGTDATTKLYLRANEFSNASIIAGFGGTVSQNI